MLRKPQVRFSQSNVHDSSPIFMNVPTAKIWSSSALSVPGSTCHLLGMLASLLGCTSLRSGYMPAQRLPISPFRTSSASTGPFISVNLSQLMDSFGYRLTRTLPSTLARTSLPSVCSTATRKPCFRMLFIASLTVGTASIIASFGPKRPCDRPDLVHESGFLGSGDMVSTSKNVFVVSSRRMNTGLIGVGGRYKWKPGALRPTLEAF